MKKSNAQKIKLGLFVILSTIILVTSLYFIGNRQNIFEKTFTISAVFNNVNGLQLGNNVRYSGINVGTVKKIKMINDTTIYVGMVIEKKILKHMKKNIIATIGSDGLVGSMIINIIPVQGQSIALISGDTIRSYSKISTNDMLTTLNTTNENAAILMSDLLKITSAINKSKGVLGLLINDTIMSSSLKQTIENLKTTSSVASKTIQELNSIITSINYDDSLAAVIFNDSISAKKIRNVITNLEKSSYDINGVISNLNVVVKEVKNGEGALNYIVNDTTLVKNIDQTIKNINEGSILLNENLEALKHNRFFRGYFKKLEKDKLKSESKLKKNEQK
jgi:phospholipid/cholesterol/gamma-HCH transport system substrate-binding protein